MTWTVVGQEVLLDVGAVCGFWGCGVVLFGFDVVSLFRFLHVFARLFVGCLLLWSHSPRYAGRKSNRWSEGGVDSDPDTRDDADSARYWVHAGSNLPRQTRP